MPVSAVVAGVIREEGRQVLTLDFGTAGSGWNRIEYPPALQFPLSLYSAVHRSRLAL